ncbi:2-oxoglutarate and iron-dependent oxygenase JMJD4 isoform X2 [Ornithorhynchus anatinus]|uniref:2-oxoglutarate and iron-dependent oxygenase JMJD4 isoform X2 n=1 Tax=Ornithorhynchus anatinus TaxID=9258 RepID=UPI0019D4DEA4|nr:2-oxoglutarate and iron-dependent oxygenase JMJD4 isoform X2 [Ornithorhynchus anatinus]
MGGRRTRGAVDFIAEAGTFGYWDFFRGYLLPNLPCLFSADFTEGWGSRRRWVTADGRPDFDYLLRRFGDAVVPVADCDAREFDANPKERMPLRDYLAYWTEHIRRGSFPRHEAYTTPVHFSSDWLNEYCDARGADDYRFVYMGPRGSWTPFHADVFRSFSWSANVCGRKRWLLFPPGREDLLRDGHGRLPFDATAAAPAPPPLEVIQEAGEVVFVPSGWHHQVYNLDDTISINHNWVNGGNVAGVWSFLQAQLGDVQREVAQWRDAMDDWPRHCQLILKACAGIDYLEFYRFLRTVAEARLRPPAALPGPAHAAFDLDRIAAVLASLLADEDFRGLEAELAVPPPSPRELLARLTEAPGTGRREGRDGDGPPTAGDATPGSAVP